MEFYIYRHPNIINVYLDSIKVYDPRGEMIYEGYLGKQQFLVDYNAFKNNIESRLLYQYDGQYSGGTLIIDWFRDDVYAQTRQYYRIIDNIREAYLAA